MINLDPRKVNQDFIRKQKRKNLLRTFSIPVAFLVILGVFFARLLIANVFYSLGDGSENSGLVAFASSAQKIFNFVDPYAAYYNAGVADLANKDYDSAINNFESSLANSPAKDQICKIYVNLALAYEYSGDSSITNGDRASAVDYYNKAEYTLSSEGCSSADSASSHQQTRADQKAITALSRIKSKRANLAASLSSDSGGINYDAIDISSETEEQNNLNDFLESVQDKRIDTTKDTGEQGLSNDSRAR